MYFISKTFFIKLDLSRMTPFNKTALISENSDCCSITRFSAKVIATASKLLLLSWIGLEYHEAVNLFRASYSFKKYDDNYSLENLEVGVKFYKSNFKPCFLITTININRIALTRTLGLDPNSNSIYSHLHKLL